jgi:hypothetical protein
MTCDRITLPGGARAIVCSSRKRQRCACGKPATLLCDWKVPTRRIGTCDAPMCTGCSTEAAPGKDICPTHAPALAAWRAAQK